MAAVNAWLRDQLEDPTVKEVKESDYYNCITLYKMVEICLKELLAKQILYVFPSILNNVDHDVFLAKSDLYTAMKYDMHKIMQIILADKNKIENIWSVIEWTLTTDVGRNMTDYIKWFRSQTDLKKFMLDNVHEIFKLVEEKNKETMQAYEKIEKLQRNVGAFTVRRLQRQQNVWYHERYNALKTLLDQAKDRKDISEYKRLMKEITGQEIEIYTKAYSKDKLFPPDHDQNKSAEFWFECEDLTNIV